MSALVFGRAVLPHLPVLREGDRVAVRAARAENTRFWRSNSWRRTTLSLDNRTGEVFDVDTDETVYVQIDGDLTYWLPHICLERL